MFPFWTVSRTIWPRWRRLLGEEIRSDVRAAYAISGHTLSAGGKRLRPALVTLAARAVANQFPAQTIYASAAAAELIHMASLIHDDVVDGAEERRGRPTANAAFGNQISVLVGDYLLAKSIYLAAREGNMDVIRVFSKVTVGLSEGEVLQITAKGDVDTSEETYLTIIQKKTAGFIAGCCEVGAMLAEAQPGDRGRADALWPELRPGVPDCRRPAGLHRRPAQDRQAALRRPARRQNDPAADFGPARCSDAESGATCCTFFKNRKR